MSRQWSAKCGTARILTRILRCCRRPPGFPLGRSICGLGYPGFRTAHGADYTGWPDYLVGTATVPMKEVLQHRADSRTVTLFNKDQLGSGYLELEERPV